MNIAEIQPREIADKEIDLIDVRTPAEYQGVHAKGAVNQPLDRLDPDAIMSARNGSAQQPLYVICQMGGRSRKACEQFVAAGHENVVNVAGGTDLWQQQGLGVVRGAKSVMSMGRQVRIASGSLVVLGVLLAVLLPVAWPGLLVAGFVGAGLVFSGVTDTCGMATVLSMMPWNGSGGC